MSVEVLTHDNIVPGSRVQVIKRALIESQENVELENLYIIGQVIDTAYHNTYIPEVNVESISIGGSPGRWTLVLGASIDIPDIQVPVQGLNLALVWNIVILSKQERYTTDEQFRVLPPINNDEVLYDTIVNLTTANRIKANINSNGEDVKVSITPQFNTKAPFNYETILSSTDSYNNMHNYELLFDSNKYYSILGIDGRYHYLFNPTFTNGTEIPEKPINFKESEWVIGLIINMLNMILINQCQLKLNHHIILI